MRYTYIYIYIKLQIKLGIRIPVSVLTEYCTNNSKGCDHPIIV